MSVPVAIGIFLITFIVLSYGIKPVLLKSQPAVLRGGRRKIIAIACIALMLIVIPGTVYWNISMANKSQLPNANELAHLPLWVWLGAGAIAGFSNSVYMAITELGNKQKNAEAPAKKKKK